MRYVCLFLLSFTSVPSLLRAAEPVTIRAELTCGHCTSYSNMVVELTANSSSHPLTTATVGQNGSIEFYGVREGVYKLTVRTVDGTVLHQDTAIIGNHAGPISIVLPEQKPVERPGSGTVSIARLKHKVPKKAKKEYNKAEDKLRDGDLQGSLQHLLKAVEIDPEYMEAHNNLGSRYMMLGDARKAQESFRRALELDPHSPLVQMNIAITSLTTGDLKSAESAARQSIDLNPADMKAKYVLGLALYMQRKYNAEAVDMLTKARDRFPSASIALAVVHANIGEQELARKSLREYLRSGNTEHKKKAEAMLAGLK